MSLLRDTRIKGAFSAEIRGRPSYLEGWIMDVVQNRSSTNGWKTGLENWRQKHPARGAVTAPLEGKREVLQDDSQKMNLNCCCPFPNI